MTDMFLKRETIIFTDAQFHPYSLKLRPRDCDAPRGLTAICACGLGVVFVCLPSVHRLAHVNRRRRDSSALYWRRRVPVLDLCPEVSQWVYEHSCGGRKVTSEKMIFFSLAVSQS